MLAPSAQTAHLPPLTAPLIGRERERRELRLALASTRLLTLVGPGDAGKTRLALQLAHDVAPDFCDGVVWYDLVSLSDAAYLPQRLGAALGVGEQPGRPALDALYAALDKGGRGESAEVAVKLSMGGCAGIRRRLRVEAGSALNP